MFLFVVSMLTLLSQPQDIFGPNRLHVRKVTRCLKSKKAANVGGSMFRFVPQPYGPRIANFYRQLYHKWAATPPAPCARLGCKGTAALPGPVRGWAVSRVYMS